MVTARSNHITNLLQYDRQVRIACTLERDRPRIGGIARHSFGPPDRGDLALALLCFTWRSTVFGSDEWEGNVIGYGQEASSAVWTSSVRIFLLSFFRWGGFLTVPRAKPDDIAGEAIDLSFRNASAIM